MMTNDAIELKLTELKPELYIKYSVIRINLINTDPDQTGPANGVIHIQVEFEKPIDLEIFPLEVYLQNIFSRKIHLETEMDIKKVNKSNT